MLGGGGSIIAVPVLVYSFGLETKVAVGTSLAIVGLSSVLAAISHYKRDQLLVKTAILFGISGSIGSLFGAYAASFISDQVQLILFAFMMLLMAIIMLLRKNKEAVTESSFQNAKLPLIFGAGIGAGILTGLLGVGGGFILVPALTLIVGLPFKKAVGTSLLIIGINSIVGAIAYGSYIKFGLPVSMYAVGSLLAAPVAGYLAYYVKQDKLKIAFSSFLLILSVWMLIKELTYL